MKQSQNVILALFDISWGEVDWILPVLYQLKIIKPDWTIICIFSNKFKDTTKNLILLSELNSAVDLIIDMRKTKFDEIFSKLEKNQVHIIFKHVVNSEFTTTLIKHFHLAKVIAHVDGPYIMINQEFNRFRYFNRWEYNDLTHDLIFVDSFLGVQRICRNIYNAKVSAVGFPRYDKFWIKRLLNNKIFLDSQEKTICSSEKRVFLFVTRDTHPLGDMPFDIYSYVFQSVISTVLTNNNNILLIKPHPRQYLHQITSMLKDIDSSRYIISNLHATQLSFLADFVISVSSSCILDALSVNKPVVEFHPFVQPRHDSFIDQNGRISSAFALLGLSAYAKNKEELDYYVNSYFSETNLKNDSFIDQNGRISSPFEMSGLSAYCNFKNKEELDYYPSTFYSKTNDTVWEKQQKFFNDLCPCDDNASYRAAQKALSLTNSQTHNLLPCSVQGWSSITASESFFLSKTNTNQKRLFLSMKRIKGVDTPVSTVVLDEFVQFFNLEVLIVTGTVNELFLSQAGKIFKEVHILEVASDLYQMRSMKLFKDQFNVTIYNSATILQKILQDIPQTNKILFWLGTHESSKQTFKNKTNTPIIEELKVILNNNISDSIIVINNIRYFTPINVDIYNAIRDRKYPSIQEAHSLLFQIYKADTFNILGDVAIAYPSDTLVENSLSVKACTLSRLYNGRNIESKTIFQALNYIAFELTDSEKEALLHIAIDYLSHEDFNVGGHYFLWKGIISFGDKQFGEATKNLKKAVKLGVNDWTVFWFLSQSAYFSNNLTLAKKSIETVIEIKPKFNQAILFLKKIDEKHI